jgi:hypothetical protein
MHIFGVRHLSHLSTTMVEVLYLTVKESENEQREREIFLKPGCNFWSRANVNTRIIFHIKFLVAHHLTPPSTLNSFPCCCCFADVKERRT